MATSGLDDVSDDLAMEETEKGGSDLKNAYLKLLLKVRGRPMKVRIASRTNMPGGDVITEIPRITDPNTDEVEITPIKAPYSYVRIVYDNTASEYLYEV